MVLFLHGPVSSRQFNFIYIYIYFLDIYIRNFLQQSFILGTVGFTSVGFNYFVLFLLYFYQLINSEEKKEVSAGTVCRNAFWKAKVGSGWILWSLWNDLQFLQNLHSLHSRALTFASAESWPVFHGWQIRCLKNSVLGILLW